MADFQVFDSEGNLFGNLVSTDQSGCGGGTVIILLLVAFAILCAPALIAYILTKSIVKSKKVAIWVGVIVCFMWIGSFFAYSNHTGNQRRIIPSDLKSSKAPIIKHAIVQTDSGTAEVYRFTAYGLLDTSPKDTLTNGTKVEIVGIIPTKGTGIGEPDNLLQIKGPTEGLVTQYDVSVSVYEKPGGKEIGKRDYWSFLQSQRITEKSGFIKFGFPTEGWVDAR